MDVKEPSVDSVVHSVDFAIVGAGPSGASAAEALACGGRSVAVFDPRGPWEKPCGGGVTARALKRYAFLLDDPSWPKQRIDRVLMIGPNRKRFAIDFDDDPFVIYSRERLNRLLLERARAAGAEFVGESVARFTREGDGWRIETKNGGVWRAGTLVGADGAAGITRTRLVGQFPAEDYCAALGFNAPGGGSTEVVLDFPPDFTGYLWAFPRTDHTNFGIANRMRERTGEDLRAITRRFVGEYYAEAAAPVPTLEPYGAKIPMLSPPAWRTLRATGDGWALVGDAAGFVDPMTGEGIYFAIRSGELLAECVLDGSGLEGYERAWHADFGDDLAHVARHVPRFYRGTFMGGAVIDRALQLAKHHKGVRTIMSRFLAGEQSYERLKRDLVVSLPRVF